MNDRFPTHLSRTIAGAVILALVGAVAVVSYRYIDPTITLRDYYVRFVIGIGTAVAFLCLCQTRRIDCCVADLLILLFGAYCTANGWLSGSEPDNQPPVFILSLSLYFTVRIFLAFCPKIAQRILLAILFSGLYEGFVGLRQLFGVQVSAHPLYKFTGTLHNPGPYAGYIAAVACIALCFILRNYRNIRLVKTPHPTRFIRQNLTVRNGLFGGSCLMLAVCCLLLPASMSRSAWLSLALTGSLILLRETGAGQRLRQFWREHRRAGLTLMLLSFALLTAVGIGTYSLKQGSADGRLLIWQVSARLAGQHPLTGIGTGRFAPRYAEAQAEYLATLPEAAPEIQVAGTPDYAFNEYLHLLVEQGGIGCLLALSVLFFTFRHLPRDNREFLYAAVALLIFALTSYPFHLWPTSILFLLSLAVLNSGRRGVDGKPALLFLLPAAIAFYAWCWPKWSEELKAQSEWNRLRPLYHAKLYRTVVPDYEKLYGQLNGEARFLYEYAYVLNQLERYAESNRIIDRGIGLDSDPMFYNIRGNNCRALKEYDRAESDYRHAYALLPNRLYPLYLLTRLYFEQGDTLRGETAARAVLEFRPKVSSPATASMKSEAEKLLNEVAKRE